MSEELTKLISAIEAGTFLMGVLSPAKNERLAYSAFSGSLDAAARLHEVLLPGWDWSVKETVEGWLATVTKPLNIYTQTARSASTTPLAHGFSPSSALTQLGSRHDVPARPTRVEAAQGQAAPGLSRRGAGTAVHNLHQLRRAADDTDSGAPRHTRALWAAENAGHHGRAALLAPSPGTGRGAYDPGGMEAPIWARHGLRRRDAGPAGAFAGTWRNGMTDRISEVRALERRERE